MSEEPRLSHERSLEHPIIWVGVIGATLGSIVLLDRVAWLALPLILAVVLYYLVQPFLVRLQHAGVLPNQALMIFLVLASFVCVVASLTVLPAMFNSLARFQSELPDTMQRLTKIASEFLQSVENRLPLAKRAGLASGMEARLDFFAQGKGTQFAGDAALFAFKWLPSLLLVPFLTFFFLRDAAAFHRLVMRAVPNAFFEKTLLLFDRMDRQMRAYFRGMFWLTVLDTITLGLGLWLLGLGQNIFSFQHAMLLGLICAVFAWVPYVGTAVGGVIAVCVCALQAPHSPQLIMGVVFLFLGVRLLDEFLYTPMTVGRALHMHPLVTVMMIFAGGMLGGVYGLLLAMPLLGIFTVLGQMFGEIWFDPRLRARHSARNLLEKRLASNDLEI
ncbi:MAG: AI-2E family transporter [Verrucomicrobia bacterium]|nr:AI-2E family transporter [Verrucomicrobiota bacterium]